MLVGVGEDVRDVVYVSVGKSLGANVMVDKVIAKV